MIVEWSWQLFATHRPNPMALKATKLDSRNRPPGRRGLIPGIDPKGSKGQFPESTPRAARVDSQNQTPRRHWVDSQNRPRGRRGSIPGIDPEGYEGQFSESTPKVSNFSLEEVTDSYFVVTPISSFVLDFFTNKLASTLTVLLFLSSSVVKFISLSW